MITLSINFKSNKDLKTFIRELKKKLPDHWKEYPTPLGNNFDTEYIDYSEKSFLEHQEICFGTIFTNTSTKRTLRGFIWLGIFDKYIKVLNIQTAKKELDLKSNTFRDIDKNDQHYQYLFNDFIENAVKPINSFSLIINKEFLIKLDIHQDVSDLRVSRPILFRDKANGKTGFVENYEMHSVENRTYEFTQPNNISFLLNISKRELKIAKNLFQKIDEYFKKDSNYRFEGEELKTLYDFFERIQISLIFSYTAVEAFTNVAIPTDYKLEHKNNKGIIEIWDKGAIERHKKTSIKIKEILPEILGVESPHKEVFWNRFLKLEEIRNSLIHQKTSEISFRKSSYQESFLKKEIFNVIYSGFELISYFCNADLKHLYFPLGISDSDIFIAEVDHLTKNQINKVMSENLP
ncbi:hypothetical protein DWB61_10880 [Ancylomarina euxinus]|uniref:Uncharacterized protein n=1 Tax=Ancylomarina euxinus TaxID=2283627 RepID=A0A425XZX6_9BACT|nr:hypothetical protein [Ancylomarina euxinus]MCZ4695443.1 hypothetical protein [Ancylomarina euxinus]MUP15639.1 hypothetical protein [Ancylomarina euxinus]RRG20922.1 hypothetical protein DWB61_10880 [Ancylomarina euxinus]